MAIKKVIQIGHPSLKAKNKPILSFTSKKTKQLIIDLRDTLKHNDLIGIAPQQIAQNYTIFVTEARDTKFRKLGKQDKFRVYINPKITYLSKNESIIYEGCGSVLNGQLFGPVKRPSIVEIEAYDENGKKFKLCCNGILARVMLHEFDHLQGVEFLEKVYDYRELITDKYYIKNIKNSKQQLKASNITIVKQL